MLALKLKRIGKKHQPSFRVVVDEKRSKLLGENIEELGWYNPHTKKFELNNERISHWLKVGAKPTASVHNLLITAGILQGKKVAVHKISKKETTEAAPQAAAATTEAKTE